MDDSQLIKEFVGILISETYYRYKKLNNDEKRIYRHVRGRYEKILTKLNSKIKARRRLTITDLKSLIINEIEFKIIDSVCKHESNYDYVRPYLTQFVDKMKNIKDS